MRVIYQPDSWLEQIRGTGGEALLLRVRDTILREEPGPGYSVLHLDADHPAWRDVQRMAPAMQLPAPVLSSLAGRRMFDPPPAAIATAYELAVLSTCGACEFHKGVEEAHGRRYVQCDACQKCGTKKVGLIHEGCPEGRFPRVAAWRAGQELAGWADHAVAIVMDREEQKWEGLQRMLRAKGWPFVMPERFRGFDGRLLDPPDTWPAGRGAYGCMLSHRAVLKLAMERGLHESDGVLVVLESDCVIRDDFAERMGRFLQNVPDDWEMLFFGGQHLKDRRPINVAPYVGRSTGTNRFHCYAVRGAFIRDLHDHLVASDGHCDLVIWPWARERKVYCPSDGWLAGQAAGYSNIRETRMGERWWLP